MKNFVEDYEDEYDEEEESEDEDDIYQMKPSTRDPESYIVKNVRDESFDEKIAKSITKIHKKASLNEKDRDFNDWVEKYYPHLEKLYSFTEQKLSMVQFFTFMYDHSNSL